jgi:hypothetical protein
VTDETAEIDNVTYRYLDDFVADSLEFSPDSRFRPGSPIAGVPTDIKLRWHITGDMPYPESLIKYNIAGADARGTFCLPASQNVLRYKLLPGADSPPAGEQVTTLTTFTFPHCPPDANNVTDYNVNLCATMDIGHCVPETNETNNCLANQCPRNCKTVVVHDPALDVSVWLDQSRQRYTDLQLMSTAGGPAGACVAVPEQHFLPDLPKCTGVKAVVTNVGEGTVNGIRARLYQHLFGSVSPGLPIDPGDTTGFSLIPGQSQDVNYTWISQSGNYYLQVIVDTVPNVTEIRTDNNNTQRHLPDIEVEDIKGGR